MDKTAVMDKHKKLTSEGWIRRFTAAEPRLSEMKEFYESMGLEVLVESFVPEEDQECQTCFDVEGLGGRYRTLYTKGRDSEAKSELDDLF